MILFIIHTLWNFETFIIMMFFGVFDFSRCFASRFGSTVTVEAKQLQADGRGSLISNAMKNGEV